MDACDPNADIENLRQLIKINTGVDVKLTKKEICQAYEDIQGGKLPLPPLVMNASRTYLVDKKSPLKPNDYELLFDSSTKRADLKRIARKVDLRNVEQMTKSQIVDAIGKRLRYMKVHEPVKFARRTRVAVNNYTAVNENNTAVNTVNNTTQMNNLNTNRVNNDLNTNRVNTNRVNTNQVNTNRVNTNRVNTNRVNTNRVNTNRVNTNRVNIDSPRASFGARPNGQRGMNFSRANVFRRGEKPAFLGGARRAVREPVRNNRRPTNMNQRPVTMNKPGFFASIFGKKNFIPAKKFNGEKKGYVFKTGNQGLGYYKNTGGPEPTVGPPQGPTLPNKPIPAILPNGDLTTEQAVAKIKQLGLRREKKFLEKLELGTVTKKQVVAEAQQALEEEKRFLAFIDGLKLLNIESEYIKQRMAVDDLQQLRVEAQIKADERANIQRSNEEKMAMFLETTSLNQRNKNSFLNRARQNGANVNKLIAEIKKLITEEVSKVLNKKKQEFRNILKDYNKLSNQDKEDLVKSIDEKTNTNAMKKLAENLIKKRIDEKKNLVAQNLLSFLTPLKINQANKNQFVKRFKNDDINVNTLKREALQLEKTQMSGNIENLRVKLNTRLGEIGLNQVNQNAIMKKFQNGNRNVEKLLQEAKQLKAQRNAESGNKAKQEYISYLNTLTNLTNDDKRNLIRNGNLNRNKALTLSKQRAAEKKERDKKDFIGFLAELGLTNENRTTMINKYNANKVNVEVLRQEAIGLRNGKISEKKAKLLAHMNSLGEVLTSENRGKLLNRVENTNLNTLKANATGIAQKRIGEKKEKERRELEAYINSLGLGVNNKRNILNQNPTLNNGKRLANTKLKEKQGRNQKIQNRKNLEAYINSLGLTTNEKVNILNKDPNLTEGKRLANNRVQMKIREKRNKNKTALSIYLNKLGLKNTEKNQFLTNLNNPNVNINAIKQRANIFVQNKKAQKQRANREEFEEYLTQLNLTNAERLEFINMITQTNNTNVTSLKKKANAYLAERIKIRRATIRQELATYLQGLNITNKDKTNIMREFNNTNTNIQVLKNRANGISGARKQQRFIEEEGEFMNYLNTLTNLTANNKANITSKLNSYFTDWESLKKSATNLALQRASEKRNKERTELENYATELGLNNTRKRALLKQLDNKVSNLSTLKREAKEMKNVMNEEARSEKRKNLLRQLTQFNITNENRSELMKQFGTTNNSSIISQAKNLESNRRSTKRDELSLFMSELGLEQTDRNLILRNFDANPKNTTLRNKATQLKQTRNKEDREKIRRELKEYLNTLNQLNNSNKKKLLANNTRSYNNVKNEANQLQAQKKVISERKKQREELVKYMNTLNMLNNANKQKLLANNSKNIANIRNEANKLQEFKKTAKRASELNTLKKSMNGLNQNSQLYVIDKFETQNVTLNSMLKEVEQLKKKMAAEKRAQNREELVDYMNGLSIGDNDKKKILKNYDSQKANFGTLKNRATQINATIKNKERQRQELSNYINELGINGTQLLKKFNDGRSTLNRLKADADKMKTVANARLVNSKRNQLRTHMKNTRLNDTTKKSFINRVNVNTNMNSLKGEVNNLNAQLKTRDEALAAKKSELSVFLNTLNDLRPENRKAFLAKVVNANTNTEAIKRNATTMNKAVKNRRVEKERQEEEERKKEEKRAREVDRRRLEQHLKGLKHLTSAEMADYMSSFERNGAKIEDVVATSKAKDKDNEKDKDTLRFYIRDAQIPQAKKDLYLRQLLQPHINTRPIKRLVNANKEAERIIGERLKAQVTKKLQTLKAITANNRAKFLNNLKTKPPNEVLAAAEKLDNERRSVRNKGIKSVADELSKLTNLERDNRKKLMNRLSTNGPEKVLANAKKLNQERKTARETEERNKRNKESVEKANLIRKGVEDKFRRINGLTKQNVKNFMEKWNKTKDQKLFDEARKLGKKKAAENNNAAAEASRLFNAGGDVKNLARGKNEGGVDKELLETVRKFVSFGIGGQRREAFLARGRGMINTRPLIKEIQERQALRERFFKELNKEKDSRLRRQYLDLIEDATKPFADVKKTIEGTLNTLIPARKSVFDKISASETKDKSRWMDKVYAATDVRKLQEISRLLDDKAKLKSEIEKSSLTDDQKRRHTATVLNAGNDMDKRRQLFIRNVQNKKKSGNRTTAETAKKLQSMNKLSRDNRKTLMNRIAKGEDARAVLRNADKLQRNRTAKQRLEAERKQKEQQRKVEEQKKLEEEKAKKMKAGQAKGDLAKSLSTLKALNRENRKELIARLNKGNTPNTILRNARQRNTEKRMKQTKPNSNPLFAPNNSKVPATNNPMFILKEQKKKNREEAARRGVSVKKAQRNRQMREKDERAKKKAAFNNVMRKTNAYMAAMKKEEEAKRREEVAKKKAESERALAKSKSNMEARKKAEAQAVRDETERRRLAMLERQKKKDAKAALRKQNKQLARATGQGVKATQKKQQAIRRGK